MSEEQREEKKTIESPAHSANPYLMPGAVVLAGLMIAYAVYATQGGSPTQPQSQQQIPGGTKAIEEEVLPITEDDHIFGSKNPDVYFIEYSDYKCGYCGLFHDTIQTILKEYDGKVAWVYRHTPYQPGGKEAAVASECIAELAGEDALWQYTEKALKNQRLLSTKWHADIAVELGADKDAFAECVSSGRYDELITKNSMNAQGLGGGGTPFNVLLTKEGGVVKFSGAQPLENVKLFVEKALNSLKQ